MVGIQDPVGKYHHRFGFLGGITPGTYQMTDDGHQKQDKTVEKST